MARIDRFREAYGRSVTCPDQCSSTKPSSMKQDIWAPLAAELGLPWQSAEGLFRQICQAEVATIPGTSSLGSTPQEQIGVASKRAPRTIQPLPPYQNLPPASPYSITDEIRPHSEYRHDLPPPPPSSYSGHILTQDGHNLLSLSPQSKVPCRSHGPILPPLLPHLDGVHRSSSPSAYSTKRHV